MKRFFGKELDVKKIWKNLDTNQRFSLSILVFLLISFPVSLLLSLSPVRLFSRAQLPASPPGLSPTPTTAPVRNPIDWTTDQVYFKADNFSIEIGDTKFYGNVPNLRVVSDPGSDSYTTLEASWWENGVEMRLYMYFRSDGNNWQMYELRTYNGQNPGDWVVFWAFNPEPLGEPYYSRKMAMQKWSTWVKFENIVLLPFWGGVEPTITPEVTPTFTPTPSVGQGPNCGTPSIPPATGPAPLTVTLHGGGSMGSAGLKGYQWDFENDGVWDTSLQDITLDPVTHIYTQPGVYQPKFRVFDVSGESSPVCDYPFDVVVENPGATPTPVVSATPSLKTRYLKPGMSGRKYKTFVRGEDRDRNKLTLEARGLPRGVSLKECKVTYSSKLSRITCEISGVPGMSGIYRPVFELRDDTGAGVTGNYTLIIFPKFLP
jgi:hypothetical protein